MVSCKFSLSNQPIPTGSAAWGFLERRPGRDPARKPALMCGGIYISIHINTMPYIYVYNIIIYIYILYYTILYYTIPYHTILYCTVLCCTVLYHTIPNHTIPYHTILYHTIPYYTILYYTVLYYTVLCYTILYCIIPNIHLYIYIYISIYTIDILYVISQTSRSCCPCNWHSLG